MASPAGRVRRAPTKALAEWSFLMDLAALFRIPLYRLREELPAWEYDLWQARAQRDGCLSTADYLAAVLCWLEAIHKVQEPGKLADWLPYRSRAQAPKHPPWEVVFQDLDAMAIRLPKGQ